MNAKRFFLNSLIKVLLCGCLVNTLFYTTACQTTKKKTITYKDRLSKREERKLIEVTRLATLKQLKGKLSKYDIAFIKKTDPVVKIDYTGHKYGKAQMVWDPALEINLFEIPVEEKINLEKLRKQSKKRQKAFYVYTSGNLVGNKVAIQVKIFRKSKVRYYDDKSKIPNTSDMSDAEIMKSFAPLMYDKEEYRKRAIKMYDQIDKKNKKKSGK